MNISNLFKPNCKQQESTVGELLGRFEKWAAQGDYSAILDLLPKMTTPTQYYLAVLSLGWAYNNSGRYAEAESWLRQVADQGREDALWQYLLADALLFQDNTDRALRHALLAREKDPQFPWSYLLLGKLFYFNGNKSAAREYLQTGAGLAREKDCDASAFFWLLQEIADGNNPAALLKA